MNTTLKLLGILGATLLAGCAADANENDDESAMESELRRADLPGVVAAQLTSYRPARPGSGGATEVTKLPTLAAKAKVDALIAALKEKPANAPRRTCEIGSPRTRITFVDAKGAEKAVASLACGEGTLTIGRRTILLRPQSTAIQAVLEMPLVPADVLFGVDEITIQKRGEPAVTIHDDARVANILGAIDGETLKTPFRMARCLTNRAVKFSKDGAEVASLSYRCGDIAAAAGTEARFLTPEPAPGGAPRLDGGVVLDARVIETEASSSD